MKQLWLAVIVLAAGIFFWQAGRIWLGNRQPATDQATVTTNTSTNQANTTTSNEPALNPEPQTHTVVAGETLNTIGLKYNLKWTSIAALNGLTEDAALQIGQILKLPITVSGHLIDGETVSISSTDAQNAQNDATFGGVTWRLDPVEVARSSSPSDTGIKHDTTLNLVSRDDVAGTAEVSANVDGRVTNVFLSQLATKGSGGVWFVTRTETYRWPN